MDCDKTDDGWFEVKGVFVDYTLPETEMYWENWVENQWQCANNGNHQALCGRDNYFTWNQSDCHHALN